MPPFFSLLPVVAFVPAAASPATGAAGGVPPVAVRVISFTARALWLVVVVLGVVTVTAVAGSITVAVAAMVAIAVTAAGVRAVTVLHVPVVVIAAPPRWLRPR